MPEGAQKALWISPGLHTVRTETGDMLCEWQYGRYVTEMVKEDGTWRFLKFAWYRTFTAPYYQSWADGWQRNFLGRSPTLGEPDRPTTYHRPYRPDEPVLTEPAPPPPYTD